jgi:hypothetical protein
MNCFTENHVQFVPNKEHIQPINVFLRTGCLQSYYSFHFCFLFFIQKQYFKLYPLKTAEGTVEAPTFSELKINKKWNTWTRINIYVDQGPKDKSEDWSLQLHAEKTAPEAD